MSESPLHPFELAEDFLARRKKYGGHPEAITDENVLGYALLAIACELHQLNETLRTRSQIPEDLSEYLDPPG